MMNKQLIMRDQKLNLFIADNTPLQSRIRKHTKHITEYYVLANLKQMIQSYKKSLKKCFLITDSIVGS